jgi:hypothetical protein
MSGLEPPFAPGPRGTSPVGSLHRTSVGDANDFRAPLRLSEGVGGGKKYEQSLGRVAEIAFIGLGSPLRYGGLRAASSAVRYTKRDVSVPAQNCR